MRLQYTYGESDVYSYDPKATFINGAPPIRTEGIPDGWAAGSFAEQDDLDMTSFSVRNRRYNNPTTTVPNHELDDINNWNSGYWASVLISPRHAIVCRHFYNAVSGQKHHQKFMGKSETIYDAEWESSLSLPNDIIILKFKNELPDDVTPIRPVDLRYIPKGMKVYQLTSEGMLHYRYANGGKESQITNSVYDLYYNIDDVMGDILNTWSGDSGTPTFVKDPNSGKCFWLGNKYGGFPYREDSQNYLDVKEYLNSEGYEWNIAKLTTGPEDVNQDGVVDAKDLGHILGAYGSKAEKMLQAYDINDDGKIDSADLGLILGEWGFSGATV